MATLCKVCSGINYVVGRRGERAYAEVCTECSADALDEGLWYTIERDESGLSWLTVSGYEPEAEEDEEASEE